ncbi:hypothetical protein [Paraburkholderia sp. BCC1886]|uniref:hypothetical protein n=1 Tax=Paraburkholderia sp. BCC1886 TaxID=2562670 RepID=UPI001182898E|nr:hypothetical protein [Paraburkholderia sp. BCC1886]
MIDILRDYLGGAASPECVQMIGDAHEAIDSFGVEDYAFRFEEILMTNEDVDQGQTVQQIYDTTRALQVELLNGLGVMPSDDARVDHLTVLLNGLFAIEHYQDPQAVIQQCSLEMHAAETLAEVLTLTTHLTAEELLVDMHHVDPMTIEKIREVSHQRLADDEPVDLTQVHAKHIEAYRNFKTIVGGLDLMMDHFLHEGVDVGYPFALYANLVGYQFEAMPVANIAANLVSMAILSSDGLDSPRSVIQPELDHLINDLDLVTKVDVAVGDLLLKLENQRTTGIRHG